MISAINYWSFERALENEAPIHEVYAQAREAGFQAIEPGIAETVSAISSKEICRGPRRWPHCGRSAMTER